MKQIFGNSAVSLVAVERSVVFASLEKKLENGEFKSWLTFHQHNFDTGVTNAITKNAYLNFLFTSHNEFLKENLDDYINYTALFTDKDGAIVLNPSGIASLYDADDKFKWRGSLKYKGYVPGDAVVYQDQLWCSYPDSNTLIRYNTTSMRQEYKIGTGVTDSLDEPFGLFVQGDTLFITSQTTGLIQTLDLKTFALKDLYKLDEPVKKYVKVDSQEVILTNTGIYKI